MCRVGLGELLTRVPIPFLGERSFTSMGETPFFYLTPTSSGCCNILTVSDFLERTQRMGTFFVAVIHFRPLSTLASNSLLDLLDPSTLNMWRR